MLPIPPALLEEKDRKLYTLLALRELGSCTHMQLLYFMFENDIMTYFDLSLALPELVSEGLAARTAHPADSLYMITPAGREQLGFFESRLPNSRVTRIKEQAPAWRARFTREKQYVGKVTQNARGEYVAHLTLVDGEGTTMAIDIPIPERGLAERMCARWPDRAGEIYQFIMHTLGEAER